MSKKSNLINNVGYNLFISFILLFSIRGFSQSTPDKDYKFLITTRYSGDEVLDNNTELEISNYGTIKWRFPSYYGTATLKAEIDAFSKNDEVITVNFNLRNNPWGHKGKLVINLYKMQLGFSEPNIDYTASQRTGFYNFETLETDKEISIRRKKEDVVKYQIINEAIARKDFLDAKSTLDKLNFRNEFPNLIEFNKLEKEHKLNNDKNQYIEIYGLINKGDLYNSKIKIKNLNFPFEFDKLDKFENLVIDSINKNLDSYNFEYATKLYDYLIKLESRTSQKETIQNALNHHYEKQLLVLQPDIFSKIISENKDSFTKLKDGQYKIILIKDGSVSAESKDSSSKKIEICSNRSYLIKDGFEYPGTFSGDLTISTDKTIMNPGDSIRYIVSEKHKEKSIYISKKGEYYFGQFGTPSTASKSSKPKIYSNDIKKNNINLEQLYVYTRNANGIKIKEGKGYFQEKTIVAKKGTGKKIVSIIGVFALNPITILITALIVFS